MDESPQGISSNREVLFTHFEPIAPGMRRAWDVYKQYVRKITPFQEMFICETSHGTTLFCNGERQSSEMTQLIYHEAMVYPALAFLQNGFRNALILGSSEGVVTHILENENLRAAEVVHVDIDEECVRLCAKHLPYGYTEDELQDRIDKHKLIFQDGKKYVEEHAGLWDLIVLDLPDEQTEDAQQNALYSEEFLRLILKRLTPNGVFITQAGCPSAWRSDTLVALWERMGKVFGNSCRRYFHSPDHEWSWVMGSPAILDKSPKFNSNIKTMHRDSFYGQFNLPTCLEKK